VGREPLGGADRVIQPHDEVAGVERDPRDLGPEPVDHRQELVGGQVGVRLQGDADAQVEQPRPQARQHVERRGLLHHPRDVGPEPIVAVADVGAGVAAAERRDGLEVPGQVAGMLVGLDAPLLPPRPSDRIRRGEADLQVQAHGVGASAERGQPCRVEPAVDRRGLEELHAVEPERQGELERRLGRELAVLDRVMVEADPHRHARVLRCWGRVGGDGDASDRIGSWRRVFPNHRSATAARQEGRPSAREATVEGLSDTGEIAPPRGFQAIVLEAPQTAISN
jgi:hypothetical protein